MEFWGVEVKAGESLIVKPVGKKYLHLSQATLELKEEGKESDEWVSLSLKVDDQKLLLGNLCQGKFPQLSFDLVFEKEFELSHSGTDRSIYCFGYWAADEVQAYL